MLFGKIEYLNLLPFHIFIKRFVSSSQIKMGMEHKKNVPAKINYAFKKRRVDAAFISSIEAKKYKKVKLGIIARKDVKSVLVIPSRGAKKDVESATSNVLVNVLGLEGEVLIGDKALRYALKNDDYIDLAQLWNQRYSLPFVFAVLAFHKDKKIYKKIEKKFGQKRVRIPQYLLEKAAKNVGVEKTEVLEYLKLISYNLDQKAERGLQKFYKEASKVI
ncbi:MqnA/MqnD/SBP family protein [Sulfurimonas microaerophilic]|uniref:MqnA/MqnD/SBP family protein n=1 Tax=Sulfurimonas microaerophilic TaxID=3058392 RepID=UPI0027151EE9|nr:MqnA/MqnD/SBP family protein [Sulfurimonas sp. hsl 1-7]